MRRELGITLAHPPFLVCLSHSARSPVLHTCIFDLVALLSLFEGVPASTLLHPPKRLLPIYEQ